MVIKKIIIISIVIILNGCSTLFEPTKSKKSSTWFRNNFRTVGTHQDYDKSNNMHGYFAPSKLF